MRKKWTILFKTDFIIFEMNCFYFIYIGLFFLFDTVLQLSLSLKLCWSQNVKFNISHIFIQSRRVKKEIATELEVPKTTLRFSDLFMVT